MEADVGPGPCVAPFDSQLSGRARGELVDVGEEDSGVLDVTHDVALPGKKPRDGSQGACLGTLWHATTTRFVS